VGIKYRKGKKNVLKVIESKAVKGAEGCSIPAILRIFGVIVRIVGGGKKCVKVISKRDFC
jgi:hypothetical protein